MAELFKFNELSIWDDDTPKFNNFDVLSAHEGNGKSNIVSRMVLRINTG